MREKGRVVASFRGGGMLVVQHADGFVVVEMIGSEGEIVVGDIVSGDWSQVSSEPLFKNGEEYDAYFQGNWGSQEGAILVARG